MEDSITNKIIINAPLERIWTLITTPENIKQWYAFGGAEVDLKPQGKITFQWDEHGIYHGIIEAVEPNHRFAFRFVPLIPNVEPIYGNSTKVGIVLTPTEDSVEVTLTESGYLSLSGSEAEKIEQQNTSSSAWDDSLKLLKELADKE